MEDVFKGDPMKKIIVGLLMSLLIACVHKATPVYEETKPVNVWSQFIQNLEKDPNFQLKGEDYSLLTKLQHLLGFPLGI